MVKEASARPLTALAPATQWSQHPLRPYQALTAGMSGLYPSLHTPVSPDDPLQLRYLITTLNGDAKNIHQAYQLIHWCDIYGEPASSMLQLCCLAAKS
jgi:hypothetical protein